jgi:tetratricopeptide (TPR) repeat protein
LRRIVIDAFAHLATSLPLARVAYRQYHRFPVREELTAAKSPLDPARAASAIEGASDRQQVFDLLLRATRSKVRFAALLSVHADHIRGRSAIADDGFSVGGIDTLRIPRNTVSALETAIASGSPSIGPLATGEPFIDGFLEVLGGASRPALLLPVRINSRTVAVVAAHSGETTPSADDVKQLQPLLDVSARALARVLAAREKAASSTVITKRTETDYEIEVSIADATTKRAQLDKFRKQGAWAEAAEGIRELIRDGMEHGDPDEDEQLELLLELGRIESEHLLSPDRAVEAWRSAQTIDASDARVLDALEQLFVQQGRWEECVELVEKRVLLAENDRVRVATLLNLASLAHEKLGDDARAIAAYERIIEIDAAHEIASRELEQLYTDGEQWPALAQLLLERASRKGEIEPLMTVAHVYEDKLHDPHDAFLVWLTVFRREPERPHLIEQLDRLAGQTDQWSELLAETRALAEEIEPQHPSVAADLWQTVGKWLRDNMGNREEAALALERAARLNPAVTDEAAELLRNDHRWAELVALLVRRADGENDTKRRAALHAEVAEIYEEKLEQPFDAIEWFERAAAGDPDSAGPLVALHRLYLDREQWDLLGDLLPRLIQVLGLAAPRAVIVDLYVELGSILADHLSRPEDAVESFRDALALDAKHVPAFQGLTKVYQATGQTEALLEASEAEVDASGVAEQVRRYADIAAAWHELARLDRAVACWHKLLALDPRNVHAHKGLARALRDEEQWADLALALRAQLKVVIEPFERVALLLELAELHERALANVDAAIGAYREVLGIDAHNRAALDNLARLYDRGGQWQAALEILQRLAAETTKDRREHSVLLARIGQIHLSARDTVKAESALNEATALDPDNAYAHEGTARVLLQQGKLVAAADKLLRAAQLSTSQPETLRLLTDAAWVYRHRLADNEQARACLQRILEIAPDHADAKQAMAELLHDSQEWESLWSHLEEQAARAKADESMPAAERLAIFSKAARCALELSKFKTAIELYDLASPLDQTPTTQVDRAEALYRSNSLDAAALAYQTIVARHQTTLERTQLIAIYRKLGAIHAELGKVPQAVGFYQKVLDIDGTHRETLEELAELHLSRNQYDDAIANLRSLAAKAPAAERIPFLERIGDLYRDKLAAAPRAMSTYLDALELDKTNRRILQRILDLQSETGQWKAAVETIDRFLDVETDRSRRGAYYLASAEIRRMHLKDEVGALAQYETALDEMLGEDPLRAATRERALDAFHVLRQVVTAAKDWKYLEQSYRRMIKRLPKEDPVLLPLWDGLGDIYRAKLEHHQSAIEAFEIAHALDADKSAHRARVLAELYAQTGVKRPQQVSERAAKLVEVDPTNADAYRALGRTALAAGRTDEAWCVARALVFLKQANKDESALYRRYQQFETRKAKGLLDEDAWSHVRHAEEDMTISAIFALTWEAAVALRAGPTKAFNLKPKERLAIEESTGVVAKIFKHSSRVLNVALPDVYVQPRRPGRLLLANCIEKGRLAPAVIVGRDLMTGYRDTEIAASVGSMIALLRPSYYLKLTLATVDELEAALAAAAAIVGRPRPTRPALEPMIGAITAELQKRLTRTHGEALLQLVHRLPEQADLLRWRNAVDATAQRAGLVISGDLAATARMIASETPGPGALRPHQRVADLVAYSVSPAYFAARRHLGLGVA